MPRQYTYITDWRSDPPVDRKIMLPARQDNFPHLSECLLYSAPDMYCTCDDDSPDWTI